MCSYLNCEMIDKHTQLKNEMDKILASGGDIEPMMLGWSAILEIIKQQEEIKQMITEMHKDMRGIKE